MIWSKQSVLLAFSLAAMMPAAKPGSTPHPRPVADLQQAAAGTTLTATDALARAQAACEIGNGGTANATQVSQLVRLLSDDTRVETSECSHRGWGPMNLDRSDWSGREDATPRNVLIGPEADLLPDWELRYGVACSEPGGQPTVAAVGPGAASFPSKEGLDRAGPAVRWSVGPACPGTAA